MPYRRPLTMDRELSLKRTLPAAEILKEGMTTSRAFCQVGSFSSTAVCEHANCAPSLDLLAATCECDERVKRGVRNERRRVRGIAALPHLLVLHLPHLGIPRLDELLPLLVAELLPVLAVGGDLVLDLVLGLEHGRGLVGVDPAVVADVDGLDLVVVASIAAAVGFLLLLLLLGGGLGGLLRGLLGLLPRLPLLLRLVFPPLFLLLLRRESDDRGY